MGWLLEVLIALDQLVNALLNGFADESLSSRAHRMALKAQPCWGWTEKAINTLFFWQPGHCKAAYESEIERSQFPPELR